MGRTEVHRKIDERAVVVNAEVNETNKTTPGSERRSLLKNCLTGPTLLEMSGLPTYRDLTWGGNGDSTRTTHYSSVSIG